MSENTLHYDLDDLSILSASRARTAHEIKLSTGFDQHMAAMPAPVIISAPQNYDYNRPAFLTTNLRGFLNLDYLQPALSTKSGWPSKEQSNTLFKLPSPSDVNKTASIQHVSFKAVGRLQPPPAPWSGRTSATADKVTAAADFVRIPESSPIYNLPSSGLLQKTAASEQDGWWQQYSTDSLSSGSYSRSMSSYERDDEDMEATLDPMLQVLKMDAAGNCRLVHVRRRDLLREHRIQPRDLRRIDPSVDFNKTSPSITIKDNVLLICIGGVRAIVSSYKALLFEPAAPATKKFYNILAPHLRATKSGEVSTSGRPAIVSSYKALLFEPTAPATKKFFDILAPHLRATKSGEVSTGSSRPWSGSMQRGQDLGISHSAYMASYYAEQDPDHRRSTPFEMEVLEAALLVATGQLDLEMAAVTRRVQTLLANLPRDINPVNLEELRRVKSALVELETKADTARKILEELMDDDDELRELNLSSRPRREERRRQRERTKLERELERAQELKEEIEDQIDGEGPSPYAASSQPRRQSGASASTSYSASSSSSSSLPSSSRRSPSSFPKDARQQRSERLTDLRAKYDKERLAELRVNFRLDRLDQGVTGKDSGEERSRNDHSSVMARSWEEDQDMITRLDDSARDLEESIGVSLSARRFEVNRLELTLSIGSFAAAVGAMVAGIFGMNMRSKLEESFSGFWGTTGAILLGCVYLFYVIIAYTRRKKIL
eukprot:gene17634-23977_t